MNIKDNSMGSKIFDAVNVIVLVMIGLLCLLPLWYVLCISLSSKDAVNAGLVSFWPVGFNINSYQKIIGEGLSSVLSGTPSAGWCWERW